MGAAGAFLVAHLEVVPYLEVAAFRAVASFLVAYSFLEAVLEASFLEVVATFPEEVAFLEEDPCLEEASFQAVDLLVAFLQAGEALVVLLLLFQGPQVQPVLPLVLSMSLFPSATLYPVHLSRLLLSSSLPTMEALLRSSSLYCRHAAAPVLALSSAPFRLPMASSVLSCGTLPCQPEPSSYVYRTR